MTDRDAYTVQVNVPMYVELPLDRFRDVAHDRDLLGMAMDDWIAADVGLDFSYAFDRELGITRLAKRLRSTS